jgi:outer membrane protein assembly factor BamB
MRIVLPVIASCIGLSVKDLTRGMGHLVRPVVTVVAFAAILDCGNLAGVGGKPSKLQLVWHAITQANDFGYFTGTPAVVDGTVYVEDGNTVLALDANTGAKKWARPVRVAPISPARNLVVSQGRVFVSEVDSILAMDIRDGHTLWNVHPDAQAVVYASVDDRALYTGQRDIPFVYALDVTDGHILWKVNIGLGWQYPGHVTGTAVSGDTVYVAARKWLAQNGYIGRGVLVALDRTTGQELWRYETPGTNGGLQDGPVIAGNLLVVSDLLGNAFFAYDRFAKRLVWRVQDRDNGPLTPPVIVGDDVYVGSASRHLFAVNLQSGAVEWDVTPAGSIGGTAFCEGQVFIQVQQIQRRDPARGAAFTGAYNPDLNVSGTFTSNIATDGTRIYFAGQGGVYALACK